MTIIMEPIYVASEDGNYSVCNFADCFDCGSMCGIDN